MINRAEHAKDILEVQKQVVDSIEKSHAEMAHKHEMLEMIAGIPGMAFHPKIKDLARDIIMNARAISEKARKIRMELEKNES